MSSPKKIKPLAGTFILVFVITSCTMNWIPTKSTQIPIMPTSPTLRLTATLEPTKVITLTSLPNVSTRSDNVTPLNNNKLTETASKTNEGDRPTTTITLTTTPPPTADTHMRETIWREMMVNPICSLPCWWEIEPGLTSWAEAQKVLNPLGIYPDTYLIPGGSVDHHASFDLFISKIINQLSLVEEKQIIEAIHVSGEGFSNPEGFREIWKSYFPEIILQEFGPPTRIYLQTWQNYPQPSDPTYKYYDLSLFYDAVGFVVIYRGRIANKSQYTVCPTYTGNLLENIHIFSQSPTSQALLEDLIGEQGGPRESDYSLQDAADMTAQQFFDLLLKNPGSACFNTKAEIWSK